MGNTVVLFKFIPFSTFLRLFLCAFSHNPNDPMDVKKTGRENEWMKLFHGTRLNCFTVSPAFLLIQITSDVEAHCGIPLGGEMRKDLEGVIGYCLTFSDFYVHHMVLFRLLEFCSLSICSTLICLPD